MLKLEAYIVSITDEDILIRHNKVGVFDSYEKVEQHANDMEIDYTLEKHGDLYLCIADLTEGNQPLDTAVPENGPIASLKLDFFPIKIED